MKIIFLPDVQLYLQELVHILYYNNYFGTEESSSKYVRELWADILDNLSKLPKKEAPPSFNRFGMEMSYVTIRKNKRTSWYVFFIEYEVEGEIVFQVRHITNNYVIAQYL
jgi:hypothetical protein